MIKPDFELPDPEHEFNKGDKIYIVDKNKYDIWEASIKKITEEKISVHYEADGTDKKYQNTKRFLLRTDHNKEIFKQQEEMRSKRIEKEEEKEEEKKVKKEVESKTKKDTKKKANKNKDKPKPKAKSSPPKTKKKKSKEYDDDEDEDEGIVDDDEDDDDIDMELGDDDEDSESVDDDQSNEYDNSSQQGSLNSDQENEHKKRKTTKKPIIDTHVIAHLAWEDGIHDVDAFHSYMMKQVESSIAHFERLYKMNNTIEFPPFKIGGDFDPKEIEKFWTQSQIIWKKLFGDNESVSMKEFLKKAPPFFKLPNQKETNARDILKFIFDPDSFENVDYVQFYAFLAMFGPHQTAIRKVGQWLSCPAEMKDYLLFPDIPENTEDLKDDTEMNCFTLKAGDEEDNEKFVYNIPFVDTDGNYLVDTEGNYYKDWPEYFAQNNNSNITTTAT